jgi:hypothetical protein
MSRRSHRGKPCNPGGNDAGIICRLPTERAPEHEYPAAQDSHCRKNDVAPYLMFNCVGIGFHVTKRPGVVDGGENVFR